MMNPMVLSKNPVINTLWPMSKYFSKACIKKLKCKSEADWFRHRNSYMQEWGNVTLKSLGVEVEVIGEVPNNVHGIYVGNHMSYLDIPLLMSKIPIIFIAKQELGKWPLIGSCCRLLGTVLVDRSSKKSRVQSAKLITEKILTEGENIAVFPSGTTTIDEQIEWRRGAFKISKQNQVPVIPFRLNYEPRRRAAYIDDDVFLPHLNQLRKKGNIKATLEFAQPRIIDNIAEEVEEIRRWCAEPLV